MNVVGKYLMYLRRIPLVPSGITIHGLTIQKHEFSTKNLQLFLYSSKLKTIRHVSNTSQTDLSNYTKSDDILLTSIRAAKKTSDILEMLRLHNPVMTSSQHIQALNTLFMLQKSKNTNLSNEEITRSPEFTALCNKILNNSRHFEVNDIMNNIKCLSYLNVSVNSNIMQMQLQLISKMINDLSLQQITFLHFLIKDLTPCPLVDALKLALPIVFEVQLKYKIDDNVYWQLEYLNYSTKYRLSQETYDYLISKINRNFDQLNSKMIKNLLIFLYHKDYSTDKYIDIINRCLQILMNRIEFSANTSDIEALLTRMIHKYINDADVFYNEQFMNTVAKYLITKKENFENVGYIIKKMNKIGYVNRELLDYFTNQLTNNLKVLENCKFGIILSYITACANANYVPPGFINLKPLILEIFDKHQDVLELPWLRLAFNLAVLDFWSEKLLEKVFSRDFLYGFLKRTDNIHDYVMLLKLYQATLTLYPGGFKGTLPPIEIIEKAINIYQQNINEFPLKAALEHGLGGSNYVFTKVRSKLGHFIDHIVVMRPGGYFVSFKNEINNDKSELLLENIVHSNDNLIIGILLHKPNNYVINLNYLKGTTALTNKSIEALGIIVLPVSLNLWNELMDFEKIPYIMRELKTITSLNSSEGKNDVY